MTGKVYEEDKRKSEGKENAPKKLFIPNTRFKPCTIPLTYIYITTSCALHKGMQYCNVMHQ